MLVPRWPVTTIVEIRRGLITSDVGFMGSDLWGRLKDKSIFRCDDGVNILDFLFHFG